MMDDAVSWIPVTQSVNGPMLTLNVWERPLLEHGVRAKLVISILVLPTRSALEVSASTESLRMYLCFQCNLTYVFFSFVAQAVPVAVTMDLEALTINTRTVLHRVIYLLWMNEDLGVNQTTPLAEPLPSNLISL